MYFWGMVDIEREKKNLNFENHYNLAAYWNNFCKNVEPFSLNLCIF